ncbi:MAG: PCRF domain-containing protein, partial [Porphyrobacter sp.]|nr:PCRF domain-containing protein [Porphyrobacter sp.]
MRAEALSYINRIEAALALVRQSLDWERALRRLDELNARVQDPALWDKPKEAQAISREQKTLEAAVNTVNQIAAEMADAVEFIEMGEAEGEESIVEDGLATLASLAERADADKVQALLSGEVDGNDTYLEIHAGAGGTESQDWAEMLLRMYARWAERRGFKVETVEYQAGEQAGIKSATLLLKGENAYGYAKTESGVHRLVRISPYDSSARRHTSFSSVWVYPVIDDSFEIDIKPADLKIDTYRASGAG